MILGITGSFGSGKSTVARIFKAQAGSRARLLDADAIARRLMQPGTPVYRRVVAVFGKEVLKDNAAIDRTALAAIVFSEKRRLEKLVRIVHPAVINLIRKKIERDGRRTVILDAPLLLEAGLGKSVDKLVVVKIKRDKQIRRLMRKGFSRADIIKRINSQMPLSRKIRQADFVIDNNGDIGVTRKQAAKIWRLLWKN